MLSAQELILAARGRPAAYTLVRSASASLSQIRAAEEFQTFTEQMTGVKLPILADDAPLPAQAILLGNTRYTSAVLGGPVDFAALGTDGFRLVTHNPRISSSSAARCAARCTAYMKRLNVSAAAAGTPLGTA